MKLQYNRTGYQSHATLKERAHSQQCHLVGCEVGLQKKINFSLRSVEARYSINLRVAWINLMSLVNYHAGMPGLVSILRL